jgi:gliding motility-associated-like protein
MLFVFLQVIKLISIFNDQYIRLGDSVRLEGLANFAIDSVVWMPTEFLNDISGPVTYSRPNVSTAYQLIAFDANGCRAEDAVWVYVDRRLEVFIPNAFSPNDDGINDSFRIFGDNKVKIIHSLRIFDRWGGNVFIASNVAPDDSAAGWDGSHRGQLLSAGVYLYFAEIEFFDGHVETVMGEVTLLR